MLAYPQNPRAEPFFDDQELFQLEINFNCYIMQVKRVYSEAAFFKAIIFGKTFFFIDKIRAFFSQVIDLGFIPALTARFEVSLS